MSAKRKPAASDFERAADAHGAARLRVYQRQADLAWASEACRRAEAELAVAARAAAAGPGGLDGARRWLVWWWNNGDSSPRGGRPCVTDWREIPED